MKPLECRTDRNDGHQTKFASRCLAAMLLSANCVPFEASAEPEAEMIDTARDAYVYGYSLMTNEVTRVQMTNVPDLSDPQKSPMNFPILVRRYPPANFRGVSSPNADTLYSIFWLDLNEPRIFSYPANGQRFFLHEIVDHWMIVSPNSPSSMTSGGQAGNVLFTGPGWNGKVPDDVTEHFSMKTRYMVILSRTYADGSEEDYKIVNSLQDKMKITPLSAWGTDYKLPSLPVQVNNNTGISMTDKPIDAILKLGGAGYFEKLAELMCDAPPKEDDDKIVSRMASIGLKPCEHFDVNLLPKTVQDAIEKLPQEVLSSFGAGMGNFGEKTNGWTFTKGLGSYGTDYMKRAVIAAFGWPANRQEEAVYPFTTTDSEGESLVGSNSYTLTFESGREPPVSGFWSITMYEIDNGMWFVDNPLNKFTISPRDNLQRSDNGSIKLYLQPDSPGVENEANWLPSPDGKPFEVMLRMYGPNQKSPSIFDETWAPPKILKVQ